MSPCARMASTIEDGAARMEKFTGREELPRALDVTDFAAVAAFVEAVEACFGHIEICVTKSGGPSSNFSRSTHPEDGRSTDGGGVVRSLL